MSGALLAFLGAVLGSAGTTWVSLRGLGLTRQGQAQDARAEWNRRLTSAVALLGDTDPEQQAIGEDILASLIQSDLGSAQDRQLAARIMRHRLVPVALAVAGGGTPGEEVNVDAGPSQRDTEEHSEQQEPQP